MPLRSFVPVAPDSDFPLENLPYGVFRRPDGGPARVGVAIGDQILDLHVLEEHARLETSALAAPRMFHQPSLNRFLSAGRDVWKRVRARIQQLLSAEHPELRDDANLRSLALVPQTGCELLLPCEIGDYTDFYSSRHHATNVGTMLRGPEQALQANWLHLPVAYHGRASSVVASGAEITRPHGQTKSDSAPAPTFGPSRAVDFELELGFFVGPGNLLGQPIPAAEAAQHIFGFVLVNDWSARDIQKWEYVPLGPFLAKNFATTISPWVVPLEALEPFRVPGEAQDPPPLAYLQAPGAWAFDIHLEAQLTLASGASQTITRTNARHLYWNAAQQLAHHACNGCNLRPGDLLASGTASGPTPESRACLLELTWGGRDPLVFSDGSQRRFLEDGDQLTITGHCQGDGYRIGFGEATGKVMPARSPG